MVSIDSSSHRSSSAFSFQHCRCSLFQGEKEIPEIELTHLDGHKSSKPVRVGNGAADHIQLVSACDTFKNTTLYVKV